MSVAVCVTIHLRRVAMHRDLSIRAHEKKRMYLPDIKMGVVGARYKWEW